MREPRATADTLLHGALPLRQSADGYRVNVDALLLAAFAGAGGRAELAVDLGAGVGTVGLLLQRAGAARRVALVEREADLVELARQNLEALAIDGTVHEVDLADGLPRALVQRAGLVVSNPPFFEPGTGRERRDPRQRRARSGELAPFVRAAARALNGARARAAFVYPAGALAALLHAADECGLVAKRLRFVHAQRESAARLALVELRRAKPGGLVIEPPLVEWSAPGKRSAELAAIVAGRTKPARAAIGRR